MILVFRDIETYPFFFPGWLNAIFLQNGFGMNAEQ